MLSVARCSLNEPLRGTSLFYFILCYFILRSLASILRFQSGDCQHQMMLSSSSRAILGSQISAVLVLALINYSISGADARKLTFAKEISKATKTVTNYKPAEQLLGVEKGKALTDWTKCDTKEKKANSEEIGTSPHSARVYG
jgi:hypothetical protein